MSFIIKSADRPEDDFTTWSLEDLEHEHFRIMMTAQGYVPPRAGAIQREINKRHSKKIELSSAYGRFNIPKGGYKRGELAVITAGTTAYKSQRKVSPFDDDDDQILPFRKQFDQAMLDQMVDYDKVLMAEVEADFAMRPITPATAEEMRRFVDMRLESMDLGIKSMYYTRDVGNIANIPKVEEDAKVFGLVKRPTGFTKIPEIDWDNLRKKLAASTSAASFKDEWLVDFSSKSKDAQKQHIFDDSIRWMYPTIIQPIDYLNKINTADRLFDIRHAEASALTSSRTLEFKVAKERSIKAETMFFDLEAPMDFSKPLEAIECPE